MVPWTAFQMDLTIRQRELYVERMAAPDAPMHNVSGYYWINGSFSVDVLEQALRLVTARADALRVVLRS
ncbi:MAG TPA: hypothetical protein VFO36_09165, partial [Nitrospiraceae bacterium]|nr:hypothetical protein [Nitrospiraceae bacterium]